MDATSNQLSDPSSSSSSSPTSWDVFLSFYGKDTRRNFIAHLYFALDQAGILTFRDDPALEAGQEISSGLFNAIRNSKKFVVVISENYARSSWCLNELVEILSCKTRFNQVVPVFYYVDPSDVRRQRGSFREAFERHKKRYSVDLIDKWKSALTEIAELPGYYLRKGANVPEADIIYKVVDTILLDINPKTCWDVFLSFSGVDTRFKFTSHLYAALDRHGLRTFMDDPMLGSEGVISDALLQAIRESNTYIVIFSENYASSIWCLDELVEILQCCKSMGRLVVPLFYNIEPSVVRHQTGSFDEAFRKHETRFDMDRLAKWRVTLTNAANLPGYHVCKKMSEAEIINKIVDEILLKINPKTLYVAKYPVGLGSPVREITREITTLLSSDIEGHTTIGITTPAKSVTRIGIHGMGGAGKTTLAKAVYNQNYHRFQGSCFLENVKEVSGTERGLVALQQQLVNDVLKCKNINIDNVYQGNAVIRARIHSTKVLIVIDDLNDPMPLEFLEGPFALGSIIIITTRNEDLLDSIKVEGRYKVNELGDDESRRLFRRHAFGDDKIPDIFTELSQEILEHAGGLPLALKVFGSNLLNLSKEGMISVDKLKRLSVDDVEKKLLVSFDALKLVGPRLQDIFLDIACFFIGWKKEEVVKILETCYKFVNHNIDILKKRCLLTINNRDELEMHDLLRNMGREIARNNSPDEPEKHSRLWVLKDAYDVLNKHKGTETIEGIISSNFSDQDALEGVSFTTETFKRMSKLRFLYLKKVNLTGSFEQTFEDLRWFFWDYCPLKCLPSEFYPEELVILELPHSKLTKMWELNVDSQVFGKLKTLNMKYSLDLTTTPDFTMFPCLETLNLEGCESLEELHISIGSLKRLVSLNLRGCVNLRSLPTSICNLTALQSLNIGGCSSLEALPVELGNIESLTEFNAWGLAISKLPDSIGRISKLVESDNEYLETPSSSMASTSSQTPSSSITYSMASTSSQPPPLLWDVFLSFRGADTRFKFTSHLYSALNRHGIRAFIDDPELRSGDVISKALIQGIQESKTYIVVFSENYASSPWCLHELLEIYECHKRTERLVIPVFYNVNPSVVRHQTGTFEEAFKKHETRFAGEMEKVKKWRRALTEVAGFSGYHKSEYRSEADVINEIVEEILFEINPKALSFAKCPIGLDSRIKVIMALLNSGKEGVIMIGLYGMGGVGKTTLAKALYNQLLLGSFKGSCFLANVREVSGTSKGLESLQEKLINDVLKRKKKVKVHNVDQGNMLIRDRICSTKVLVVIDDLGDRTQFKSLVGPFASGSVVIITTRDKEVLDTINVKPRYQYKVNELDDEESLTLFSQHAFGNAKPNNWLNLFSKDILHHAGGLPLALEVFGSNLYKQSEVGWNSYIEKLQPNSSIEQKLIISLDALESDDPMLKKMFLDIACFFIGWKKEEAIKILQTYYSYADHNIDIMRKRCLLTINNRDELGMQVLLRDIGREIALNNSPDEPGKHSRLWVSKDICDVLQKHKGTSAIEGIIPRNLYYQDALEGVSFTTETFRWMSKLRFLYLKKVNLIGSFEQTFEDLRWFCWDYCPLKCLPSDFYPEKLVILELPHSKMRTMLELNMVSPVFDMLKTLNMSFSQDLIATPDFTILPCLETLNLKCCESLEEVHISIGSLVRLVSLDLCGCVKLRSLPDTICNLRALEVLSIGQCSSMDGLPIELGKIRSLRELNAEKLTVSKLPDSIGRLSKLVELRLSYNKNLETLPDTIYNLRSLENLDIGYCGKLLSIADFPPNLKWIRADGCTSMERLPNLSNLKQLEELDLTYCSSLIEIVGLEELTSITALHLEGCNPSLLAYFTKRLFQVLVQTGAITGIHLLYKPEKHLESHKN